MKLSRLVLVVAVVVGWGCTQIPVVGVVGPSTGTDAAYGLAVDRGVDLALEDASGRLPDDFQMVRVDSRSSPERAAEEVRRLVRDQGVRVILGGMTSAEADALLPVIEDEQVVCLSPSASGSDLGRRSRYFYRLAPTDEEEGRAAARHLVNERGVATVVVYTDGSRLTRDVEAEFRQYFEMKLGGKIVATVHLSEEGWRDRSADTLNAFNPEAVYIVGHAARILESLDDLKFNGFKGVRCTTSTFYLADVLADAGPIADNVIFPLPVYDVASSREPSHTFVEQFEGRYGRRPDIFSAQGFDAMRVAIRTLVGAESLHSEDVRKALSYGLRDFLGVTGPIAFNEAGDVTRYPVMHCIRSGCVRPCSTLREETKAKIRTFIRGMG
jgi:branched-chain amino acid transport system substrate-binding protein